MFKLIVVLLCAVQLLSVVGLYIIFRAIKIMNKSVKVTEDTSSRIFTLLRLVINNQTEEN